MFRLHCFLFHDFPFQESRFLPLHVSLLAGEKHIIKVYQWPDSLTVTWFETARLLPKKGKGTSQYLSYLVFWWLHARSSYVDVGGGLVLPPSWQITGSQTPDNMLQWWFGGGSDKPGPTTRNGMPRKSYLITVVGGWYERWGAGGS